MKKIDSYVEQVCSEFNESDSEIKNLKEEIKTHLYEEVEELKKKGFSEEESIEKALNSFGEEKSVVGEMNTIWKKESKFTLLIVKVAISIFIIGCLFMAASKFYKFDNKQYANSSSDYMINVIFKQVISKDSLQKGEIDRTLDGFNNKNNNGIYYVKIEKSNDKKYEYKKDTARDITWGYYDGKISTGVWTIYYREASSQHQQDMDKLSKVMQLNTRPVNLAFKEIAYAFFLASVFVLSMAFYTYIGRNYKIIFVIALLDFGTTGVFLAADYFPKHMIIASISIFMIFILVFVLMRVYFTKSGRLYK